MRVRGKALLTWDDACVDARFDPTEGGIPEMKSNSVVRLGVATGGSGLVGHVGLHALGAFVDRLGVGASLSCVVA